MNGTFSIVNNKMFIKEAGERQLAADRPGGGSRAAKTPPKRGCKRTE